MATQDEKIIQFRKLFNEFDHSRKVKELNRLKRVVNGTPPILMWAPDDPENVFIFNTIHECVKWLRGSGYPKAANGNIYKVLKKQRKTAYNYCFEYER